MTNALVNTDISRKNKQMSSLVKHHRSRRMNKETFSDVKYGMACLRTEGVVCANL